MVETTEHNHVGCMNWTTRTGLLFVSIQLPSNTWEVCLAFGDLSPPRSSPGAAPGPGHKGFHTDAHVLILHRSGELCELLALHPFLNVLRGERSTKIRLNILDFAIRVD